MFTVNTENATAVLHRVQQMCTEGAHTSEVCVLHTSEVCTHAITEGSIDTRKNILDTRDTSVSVPCFFHKKKGESR